MTAASGDPGIGERIRGAYPELSPQEQRAADFILLHLDDVAVYSATEVAEASGVSKATVSRLYRSLGFRDSQEFREQARRLRGRGVPIRLHQGVPAEPSRGSSDDTAPYRALSPAAARLTGHFAREREMLAQLERDLDPERVNLAAAILVGARAVLVLGLRNSYPVALHLREQLVQSRRGVRIAPVAGQTLAEELAGLEADDAVVLVAVRRRPRGFRELIEALTARGVPVIVIADASARTLARGAAVHFEVPIGGAGAFDSYAVTMSLSSVLADAVLELAGEAAERRVEEITALYGELDELELR